MPPPVKLAAIRDALDRAGLSARQALDVAVEPRFVQMFDRIERDASQAGAWGAPDAPAVVDGEVVGDWGEFGDGRKA
jgi:hypothetical protein